MKPTKKRNAVSDLSSKLKSSNAESQHFIRALKKEIVKLQKQNANLKAKNFSLSAVNISLNRQLKVLEKEHSKCYRAPYEIILEALEKHDKAPKK